MSTSLHDDIQFIKDSSYGELTSRHLKLVFDTYYGVFGEVCTGCPTKIAGYIKRLKNHDIMAKKNKKSDFVLKNGALIVFKGESKAFSNANLTDDAAIRFLKGNKNRRALFAKLPKNLDELLSEDDSGNNEPTAVKIGANEISVEKAVELLSQVGVTTKAKTVDGVQKRVDELDDDQSVKINELLSADITKAAKNDEKEEVLENTASKGSDQEE